MCLACRCQIRKNLSTFGTWIYVDESRVMYVNFSSPNMCINSGFIKRERSFFFWAWYFRNGRRTKWVRKEKEKKKEKRKDWSDSKCWTWFLTPHHKEFFSCLFSFHFKLFWHFLFYKDSEQMIWHMGDPWI